MLTDVIKFFTGIDRKSIEGLIALIVRFRMQTGIDKQTCRHCLGLGVCRERKTYSAEYSCHSCVQSHFPESKRYYDFERKVKCAVCNGTGRFANSSKRVELKPEYRKIGAG